MTRSLSLFALIAGLSLAGPVMADSFADAVTAVRRGDAAEGAVRFLALSRQGDAFAMYNLSVLYARGLGVPQSTEQALYWAWRARLEAFPQAPALIARLTPSAGKAVRQSLYERLGAEQAQGGADTAARRFVRLALIEEGLAARPDRQQIYVWSAMAVALGYLPAASLRDETLGSFTEKQAAEAEAALMQFHAEWCGGLSGTAPQICAIVAAAPQAPDAASGGKGEGQGQGA